MMSLGDTFTLAFTKLRTRKVRTVVTIVIAGLLFSLVGAFVLIVNGVFNSVDNLTEESYAGRYIVAGTDGKVYANQPDPYNNKQLIKEAQRRYEKQVAKKRQEATRLGIDYETVAEPPVTEKIGETADEIALSFSSPIAQQVMAEYKKEQNPPATFEDFKQVSNQYSPTKLYTTQMVSTDGGVMHEMIEGKENFAKLQAETMLPDVNEITMSPTALVKNYLLPDNGGWQPTSGTIPVVVTQVRAAKLVSYSRPKADAPASQRLEYLQNLRKKVAGKTLTVCYRNEASVGLVGEAIAQDKEIKASQGKKDYIAPTLQYGLPSDKSCGAVKTTKDTRSAEEKELQQKLETFSKKFGEYVSPEQQKITYQVVGVAPNTYSDEMPSSVSLGVSELIATIFSPPSFRFSIPTELYDQLPTAKRYESVYKDETSQSIMLPFQAQFFAEFDNAGSAKQFAKDAGCTFDFNGGCSPAKNRFMLMAFGSNSIALDEVRWWVGKVVEVSLLFTIALSALIAGLTIGRTIADSRRETAVFRAIGFKRFDIVSVYGMYTLLLCLCIVVLTSFTALMLASLVDNWLWVDATAQAQLSLGLAESKQQFRFVGHGIQTLQVIGAIFLTGLIGMSLPLSRNVRRSPIRDMRDE